MANPFNGQVRIDENEDGLYAIQLVNGDIVSDYYDEIEFFSDELAKVYSSEDEKYALIDIKGNIVSEWFDEIEDLENDLAIVHTENDRVALINAKGKLISDWYNTIEEFEDGHAKVFNEYNQEALIDTTGKLISDWYLEIGDFEDDYAKVINDKNEEALINVDGKRITAWYEEIEDFDEDLAIVKNHKDEYALINRQGERVSGWNEDYDEVEELRENFSNNDKVQTPIPIPQPTVQQSSAIQSNPQPQQFNVQQPQPNKNQKSMYNEQLEQLIEAALADGVITDKERQILLKKAESFGIDLDEFEMVLDARLTKVQQANRPAKEKLGNIVTCPACGAHVPGGSAVCPECGHEFRNVEATSSMQRFAEGLQKINDQMNNSVSAGSVIAATFGMRGKKSPIEQYITSFPVPNTSEDLLEFLSFVQGQAKKHDLSQGGSSLSPEYIQEHSYWVLYEKCINKAKISFAKDQRFIPFFTHYETEDKKGTVEGNYKKKVLLYCAIVLGAIILLSILASIF